MAVMRIALTVEFADGTVKEFVAQPREIIAFERQYDLPMSVFGGDQMRFEHLLFLAWSAACRDGETREFDDWVATVTGVEPGEEQEGSDPLDRSPATGSSPNSS